MAPQADTTEHRLPTLLEVLNLRTKPPVDLWCFYAFMKEEYKGIEYLEFWLAVVKHLSLCRNYVRGLRQSIVASERDISSSRTSSVLLDTLVQGGTLDDTDSHRLSAFLRGEDPEGNFGNMYRLSTLLDTINPKDQHLANEIQQLKAQKLQQQSDKLNGEQQENSNFPQFPNAGTTTTTRAQERRRSIDRDSSARGVSNQIASEGQQEPENPFNEKASEPSQDSPIDNASFHSASQNPIASGISQAYNAVTQPRATSSLYDHGLSATPPRSASMQQHYESQPEPRIPPARVPDPPSTTLGPQLPSDTIRNGNETISSFVSRSDIKKSTHYILVTYFIPGAEREIILPQHIMRSVRHAIEVEGRDDPEVFDEAREYVFETMQKGAFKAFLASKALGNTSPFGNIVRLICGLVALFAALWVAFILIFLDWRPERVRLWLILPFEIGIYGICAGLFSLDPILVLLGYSEIAPHNLIRIREPYVRRVLLRRSLYTLVVGILLSAGLVCLFTFVPGKRL